MNRSRSFNGWSFGFRRDPPRSVDVVRLHRQPIPRYSPYFRAIASDLRLWLNRHCARAFHFVERSVGRERSYEMVFYLQMRWNIEGRLKLDNVWDLELEESEAAGKDFKLLGMYKVAGQRRVIAIVEIDTADDLDRVIMGRLPMREVLEFEAIWPLRSFDGFLADCRTHFGAKVANVAARVAND